VISRRSRFAGKGQSPRSGWQRFHPEILRGGIDIGTRISVATPRMLYRMKRDTVRPQDRLDAQVIKEEFKLEEE